jgi:hypothetical protein
VKFPKLYQRRREAGSLGSISAFVFVRSQSTAKIFLAPTTQEVITTP